VPTLEVSLVPRPRHSHHDIEAAISYAEAKGWIVKMSKGHPWGTLWCPERTSAGCHFSVSSTPKNSSTHSVQIRRRVDKCAH